MKLKTLRATVFKARPLQSSQLADEEKVLIPKSTTFEILEMDGAEEGHVKVRIHGAVSDIPLPFLTGYFFQGHVEVEVDSYPPNTDKAVQPVRKDLKGFKLPGYKETFYLDGQLFPGSSFTWAEATKNGTRMPESLAVVDAIIVMARELQKIRDYYRRPIIVTSWYRPPAVNRAVGGASQSLHLTGAAADIIVQGVSPRQVADLLWYDWNWQGGVGDSSAFTHCDLAHIVNGWARRRWRYSS